MSAPLLAATNLVKTFQEKRSARAVRAVDGVSFSIAAGETLALVGESGCGKSTLGRLVLRLIEPTAGTVTFEGRDVTGLSSAEMRALRRRMQVIFQDPYGSLSPRRSIRDIIAEPLDAFSIAGTRAARRDRVAELLGQVGLSASMMDRYPRQFSGGQRQRIGIARAIALDPALIIADEPVSALDVSVQAQIVNLMRDLQESRGLAYLFIAHDLAVVRHIATRVAVMYLGRIVEIGAKDDVYRAPHHPYTQALLSAAPEPDPDKASRQIVLQGDIASPTDTHTGCSFQSRCPIATDLCRRVSPEPIAIGGGRIVACHHARSNPIPV